MNPFKGIIIQVLSNGQPLKLYDDPDAAEIEDERTRHHYVEAITDATFAVKVMLTTEFELDPLRPNDNVNIEMNLDGQDTSWSFKATRANIEGDLLKGTPGGHTFGGASHFCPALGQWMRSDFAFGKLETKEATETSVSAERMAQIGRIQIQINRVKRTKLDRPKAPYMNAPEPSFKELPEKALKGRNIANTVIMTNSRPFRAPIPEEYHYANLPGSAGKKTVFNIFYRSRRALQMLGCIPRSPSPALEIPDDEYGNQSPEIDGATSSDLREEVHNLRARLALLERGTNVKSEPGAAVKREWEDREDAGPHQRRRKAVKIETVDLTGD